MRGTKRLAGFESKPESNDLAFSSERVMGGSILDGTKVAGPSQHLSLSTPQLNVHRAASSRQHVRALNAQFASWVQLQLQNHPDELWEDGVRDYLSHASSILEKFSDIVKWIKENGERVGNGSVGGSHVLTGITSNLNSTAIKTNPTTSGFATPFVMPFTSQETKLNSETAGPLQGNSVISSATLKLDPTSGSEDKKSNTSSTGIFLGNTTTSFAAPKMGPVLGSKDSNSNMSSSGFSLGNTTSSFSAPNIMPVFGSQDTNSNTAISGFSLGNTSSSFGTPKSMSVFGGKDTNSNTSSSGSSLGNTISSVSTPKFFPDFGGKDTNSNTPSIGFSVGNTFSSVSTPKFMPIFGGQGTTSKPENAGIPQGNATPIFAPSWGSGSGAPFTFGNKSLTPVNTVTPEDAEEETEPEQPSSPSLKKTEEEGVVVVHEVKCKLYVKSTDADDKDAWKDRGMGNLTIKCKEGVSRGTKESKPTIIVRNDVGRLLLNALIYPGIRTNLQKNSIVAIFHTSVDDGGNNGASNGTAVAHTFLIRTKTEEDRNKLDATIQECAPAI